MKIKRYEAAEMRLALRQVRDELGPDAVILSSRRLGDRVEVTVAMDYDVESAGTVEKSAAPALCGTAARTAAPAIEALQNRIAATATVDNDGFGDELRTLRRMLETQVAQLAWNDLARRAPLSVEVLRELAELGFAHDVAARVADRLPQDLDLTRARRLAISRLADELGVTGDRWMEYGGIVALVGSTGVGKTTTLAKLAARWVLRHGQRSLALISTDSLRFGAHEQVLRFARLLGVPGYAVDDLTELPALLERLAERKLILIDTAGMSQRDERWAAMLAQLSGACKRMDIALTLAANAQAGTIEEIVARCASFKPTSCVVTKLDEATSLGGTLSSLIRTGLPASYVSDGQRIPEDLRPARSFDLVALAVSLAEHSGASIDEETLSRRMGGRHVQS
jgi:flagellar biosynthesis protein FlhF